MTTITEIVTVAPIMITTTDMVTTTASVGTVATPVRILTVLEGYEAICVASMIAYNIQRSKEVYQEYITVVVGDWGLQVGLSLYWAMISEHTCGIEQQADGILSEMVCYRELCSVQGSPWPKGEVPSRLVDSPEDKVCPLSRLNREEKQILTCGLEILSSVISWQEHRHSCNFTVVWIAEVQTVEVRLDNSGWRVKLVSADSRCKLPRMTKFLQREVMCEKGA